MNIVRFNNMGFLFFLVFYNSTIAGLDDPLLKGEDRSTVHALHDSVFVFNGSTSVRDKQFEYYSRSARFDQGSVYVKDAQEDALEAARKRAFDVATATRPKGYASNLFEKDYQQNAVLGLYDSHEVLEPIVLPTNKSDYNFSDISSDGETNLYKSDSLDTTSPGISTPSLESSQVSVFPVETFTSDPFETEYSQYVLLFPELVGKSPVMNSLKASAQSNIDQAKVVKSMPLSGQVTYSLESNKKGIVLTNKDENEDKALLAQYLGLKPDDLVKVSCTYRLVKDKFDSGEMKLNIILPKNNKQLASMIMIPFVDTLYSHYSKYLSVFNMPAYRVYHEYINLLSLMNNAATLDQRSEISLKLDALFFDSIEALREKKQKLDFNIDIRIDPNIVNADLVSILETEMYKKNCLTIFCCVVVVIGKIFCKGILG